MKADVIIPCFNEVNRVTDVVNVVKQSNCVNKIIVVDDGSNKKTKSELNKINDIILIVHKNNKGKTAAIKSGISLSKADKIIFVDSDLIRLKKSHISSLHKALDTNTDMVIGLRGREHLLAKITGMGVAFSGERVFWRKTLIKNNDIFNVEKYLLEPELNKRFFYIEKVKVVRMKGVNQVNKVFKYGIKGLIDDIKMLTGYAKYLGLIEFLRQLKLGLKFQFST